MSELRQRKPSPGDESSDTIQGGVAITTGERTTKYVEAIASSAPSAIQPYLMKAAPVIGKAAEAVELAIPYLHLAHSKYLELVVFLTPYKVDLLLPSLIGLIMCFFGGSFLTLIAAFEAYRMCGYEQSLKCLNNLSEDFNAFMIANAKDDKVDADNDGVADVLQESPQKVATRKFLLFLKTVEPNRITDALAGLNSGFLAVVATLKLQFAKAITLGNSIGDVLMKPASKYLKPALELALPSEYKKWAGPIVSYSVKSFAISLAWTLQRIISAFHSAIRGGLMFSRNIITYLNHMKIININDEETYLDEVVGYAVALTGFWFQLSMGFGLPFPLNVLLLPFTIMEYLLMWIVNSK